MRKQEIFERNYKGYKLVAIQQAPEYTEPPLIFDYFEANYPNVIVMGNRDYKYYGVEPWFEKVWEYLEYAKDTITDINNGVDDCYDAVEDYLNDYFPNMKDGGGKYEQERADKLIKALEESYMCKRADFDACLCKILTIMFDKEWDYRTLRGVCQRDWQGCYYCTEDNNDDIIDALEAYYFNTGNEYQVYFVDENGNIDEDEYEYDYVYKYPEEQQLADNYGCKVTDIKFFKHSGYIRISKYEED